MGRKLEKFCPLRVFHTGAKSKFTQITDFNFRLAQNWKINHILILIQVMDKKLMLPQCVLRRVNREQF